LPNELARLPGVEVILSVNFTPLHRGPPPSGRLDVLFFLAPDFRAPDFAVFLALDLFAPDFFAPDFLALDRFADLDPPTFLLAIGYSVEVRRQTYPPFTCVQVGFNFAASVAFAPFSAPRVSGGIRRKDKRPAKSLT
jgi:hypothetical protein